MKIEKGNNKGFTLAEVLITLGIIGVVASLTIPSLMANYQKVQYVAGLKKAYAEVTEALKLMANDNGCPDNLKCVDSFSSDNDTLGNEFKKYFKLAKDCGTNYDEEDESTKCMPDSPAAWYDGSYRTGGYHQLLFLNTWGYYNFITADGFGISLDNEGNNCESSNGADASDNLNQVCGTLRVDTNGLNGPNTYGRDIFVFYITNGKGPALYPNGGSEMPNQAWEAADGTPQMCYEEVKEGDYCAGRVMEQGWQMLY